MSTRGHASLADVDTEVNITVPLGIQDIAERGKKPFKEKIRVGQGCSPLVRHC